MGGGGRPRDGWSDAGGADGDTAVVCVCGRGRIYSVRPLMYSKEATAINTIITNHTRLKSERLQQIFNFHYYYYDNKKYE